MLETKNLSASKSLRICAPDQRYSAAVAGYVGAFVIGLVLSVIILMDCSTFITSLHRCMSKWNLLFFRLKKRFLLSRISLIYNQTLAFLPLNVKWKLLEGGWTGERCHSVIIPFSYLSVDLMKEFFHPVLSKKDCQHWYDKDIRIWIRQQRVAEFLKSLEDFPIRNSIIFKTATSNHSEGQINKRLFKRHWE